MGEFEAARTLVQITAWGNALAWMIAALAAIAGALLARKARVPMAGPGVLAAGLVVLATTTFVFSLVDLVAAELGEMYSLMAMAAVMMDLLGTLVCVVGLALLKRPPVETVTAEAAS